MQCNSDQQDLPLKKNRSVSDLGLWLQCKGKSIVVKKDLERQLILGGQPTNVHHFLGPGYSFLILGNPSEGRMSLIKY